MVAVGADLPALAKSAAPKVFKQRTAGLWKLAPEQSGIRHCVGKILVVDTLQFLKAIRLRMRDNGARRIDALETTQDKLKESKMFFGGIQRRAASKALVEAGPELEGCPPEAHVCADSNSAEIGLSEPVRGCPVHDPSLAADARGDLGWAPSLRSLAIKRQHYSGRGHHGRFVKLVCKTFQPVFMRKSVIVGVGDQLC